MGPGDGKAIDLKDALQNAKDLVAKLKQAVTKPNADTKYVELLTRMKGMTAKYLKEELNSLPPGWIEAKANGKMFYYKPEEMVKFGWKRLKDKFVPPPPTPGLRKPSPP